MRPQPALVAGVLALTIALGGTATADAPPTIDERVAALERRVDELSAQQEALADQLDRMASAIAAPVNLARCVVAATGIKTKIVTIDGRRERVIVDADVHHRTRGVNWLAEVHPDCIPKRTASRGRRP